MTDNTADAPTPDGARKRSGWARWAPLGVLAAAATAGFYFFGDFLSLEALRENRADLLAWRDQNYVAAAATFVGVYALAVALSIPGALWMTLAGGFLFGLWPGAPMIVVAATAGAMVIFLVARGSFGAVFRSRAGPWMRRFERGFQEDAASWLLIMRLTPVVPFFVANVAPALLGARARTFFWTTLIGIAPATAVYTWVGSGLGAALEASEIAEGDVTGVILQPEILGPLIGLVALSAMPILVKRWRAARRAARGADLG